MSKTVYLTPSDSNEGIYTGCKSVTGAGYPRIRNFRTTVPNRFDRCRARAYTATMEVRLKPETEARLHALASESGRSPEDLVQDAMASYLNEITDTREMLDKRYDDIVSGRVKPLDGEQRFARLRSKSRDRRSTGK